MDMEKGVAICDSLLDSDTPYATLQRCNPFFMRSTYGSGLS